MNNYESIRNEIAKIVDEYNDDCLEYIIRNEIDLNEIRNGIENHIKVQFPNAKLYLECNTDPEDNLFNCLFLGVGLSHEEGYDDEHLKTQQLIDDEWFIKQSHDFRKKFLWDITYI